MTVASGDGVFFGGTDQGPNVLAGLGFALGDRRGLRITANVDAQQYVAIPFGRGSDSPGRVVSGWIGVDWF